MNNATLLLFVVSKDVESKLVFHLSKYTDVEVTKNGLLTLKNSITLEANTPYRLVVKDGEKFYNLQ